MTLIVSSFALLSPGEQKGNPMPLWFKKFVVAKVDNEKVLRQYRGDVWAGTWQLFTYYMSSTSTNWNIVVWSPEGLTGTAPVVIFWPGAGENGTDTSKLLNGNSPFYHIKQGTLTGTVLGQQCRFAAIQSQGNIHSAANLAAIMDYTINVSQADTNRIYLTGLSRGASQIFSILSAESSSSKYWRTTAMAHLSLGTNTDPSPTSHLPWFNLGGRSYSTMGTLDTLTYGRLPKWLRIYQPLYPNQIYQHWIPSGGHSGWQLEYNPTTKRFNGYNLYENLLTNSKKPYAAIGNGSSIKISPGTASLTLNGINRQYTTGNNGWNAFTTWTKVSGPSVTIVSPSSDTTTITDLNPGIYVFRYTRTNGAGGQTAYAEIEVSVAYVARVRYSGF